MCASLVVIGPIANLFFLRLHNKNPANANSSTAKTQPTEAPTLTANEGPRELDELDEARGDVLVVVVGAEVPEGPDVVRAILRPLTGTPKTVTVSDCRVDVVSVNERPPSSWNRLRKFIVSPGLTVDIHCEGNPPVLGCSTKSE